MTSGWYAVSSETFILTCTWFVVWLLLFKSKVPVCLIQRQLIQQLPTSTGWFRQKTLSDLSGIISPFLFVSSLIRHQQKSTSHLLMPRSWLQTSYSALRSIFKLLSSKHIDNDYSLNPGKKSTILVSFYSREYYKQVVHVYE